MPETEISLPLERSDSRPARSDVWTSVIWSLWSRVSGVGISCLGSEVEKSSGY